MRFKILFLLCLLHGSVNAQNQTRFGQINFAQSIHNPAALAIDAKMQVDLMFRNQWFQFDGAPTTFAANAQYELDFDMAVGLNFFHDRIGATQSNSVTGQYAYRLLFDRNNALIFGVGAGIETKTSDFSGAVLNTANDPAFALSYSKVFFQSSVGVYYYSPNFYAGVSVPQMFQTNFGEDDGFNLERFHTYFSTGFYINAGDNYTLNPNIQVKAVRSAPIQGDIILRNTFYGRFSFVAGFRSEMSIIAGADFLITPYTRVGYSFNYDVGSLARIKGVSNEFYLGVGLPYRNSRKDFGERIYLNRKGGFNRSHKRKYRRKRGGR